MVEYTKIMCAREIEALDYKNLGIFFKNSDNFNKLLLNATIKNKYDLILLVLDEGPNSIYQVFLKRGKVKG